jgi:Na+/glutamate symporter
MISYWRYVLNKLLIPLAIASGLILAIVCLKLNGAF